MFSDFKCFIADFKKQDLAFYSACAYIVFEYLRPHTILPWLDFLPWAQLSLMTGLGAVAINGQLRFQTSHFYVLLFVLVTVMSSIYSEFPEDSFRLIDVPISWFVVVFVFSNCVRTIKQFQLILIIFFVIVFKMSLFGAKTWMLRGFSFTNWGISGPSGWFENSGELALLMVVFSAISYGYLISNNVSKKWYYLLPITGVMTIIAASSRGSQLALAIIFVIASFFIWKISFKNLCLFGLVAFLAVTMTPKEQKGRFESMGEDATSESRLMYWEKGLDMLNEHQFLGIGFNVFPKYFEQYYAPYIEFENFTYRSEVAHNTLIQVASEMGYFGLISYLLMVWGAYRLMVRVRCMLESRKNETWVYEYTRYVDLALVGYLVGSFFMSVALYPYIYLFLALNQALANAVESNLKPSLKGFL